MELKTTRFNLLRRLWHKNQETIAIDITDTKLTLTALDHSIDCIQAKAHETFVLDHEVNQLAIYNGTTLKTYIDTFVAKYRLTKAKARISLHGASIIEKITEKVTTELELSLQNYCWQELECHHQQKSYVYVAALGYPIIAQYQLIAISSGLNLELITSRASAYYSLLHAYGNKEVVIPFDSQKTAWFSLLYKQVQDAVYLRPIKVDKSIDIEEQDLLTAISLCYARKTL